MSENKSLNFNIENIENFNYTVNLTRTRSEESSTSISTLSDCGVKRRRCMDYFNGDEDDLIWNPKSRLIVDHIDVTKVLNSYRKRNKRIAETTNVLSDLKNLSLSYIFPVDKVNGDKSVTKLFEEHQIQPILEFMYGNTNVERASGGAVLYCKNVADRFENDFQPRSKMDELIQACCRRVQEDNSEVEVNSEGSKRYIFASANGIEENRRFPDWKLGCSFKSKQQYLLFVEVKRSGQTSKYQDESDYVKLLKFMKESLNQQVDLGFTEPSSFGLLIEGYKCIVYKMTIKEDGIYVPIMVKRFTWVENLEDVVNVPAIVESLLFVKEELDRFNEKIKNRKRGKPLRGFVKGTFYAHSI